MIPRQRHTSPLDAGQISKPDTTVHAGYIGVPVRGIIRSNNLGLSSVVNLARHPPSFFLRERVEPDDEVLPLLTPLPAEEISWLNQSRLNRFPLQLIIQLSSNY